MTSRVRKAKKYEIINAREITNWLHVSEFGELNKVHFLPVFSLWPASTHELKTLEDAEHHLQQPKSILENSFNGIVRSAIANKRINPSG
jgi:hypothetical protein